MPKRDSVISAGFPRLQRVATSPASVDSLVDELVMAIAGPSLGADRPEVDQFQRRISELQGHDASEEAIPAEPPQVASSPRGPHPIEERMRRLDRQLRNLEPEPVSPDPSPPSAAPRFSGDAAPATAGVETMHQATASRPVVRAAGRRRPEHPIAAIEVDDPWFDEAADDTGRDRRFIQRMLFAAALATLAFLSIPILARLAHAQTQSESVVAESLDRPVEAHSVTGKE